LTPSNVWPSGQCRLRPGIHLDYSAKLKIFNSSAETLSTC